MLGNTLDLAHIIHWYRIGIELVLDRYHIEIKGANDGTDYAENSFVRILCHLYVVRFLLSTIEFVEYLVRAPNDLFSRAPTRYVPTKGKRKYGDDRIWAAIYSKVAN